MEAAVIERPRAARVRDLPEVRAAPDEAIVRIEGCGLCGSDLPVWQGRDWFRYPAPPGRPGHEAWGRVEAPPEGAGPAHGAGADAPELRRGQRVVGLMGAAFAEACAVPADALLPVPAGIPADAELPAEALACAVNAVRRAGVEEGDRVAVVGVGFQGALLTRLCTLRGAEVTAASRRETALRAAQRSGAAVAVAAAGPEDEAAVRAGLGAADGFDVVFEATGQQASLDLAGRLVRTRGRLAIVGYHQDGPRTVDMQMWNWKGIDVVNAHERDAAAYLRGMQDALRLVAAGRLRVDDLVTHRFPLADLDAAFATMEARPDGFLKAVVRP